LRIVYESSDEPAVSKWAVIVRAVLVSERSYGGKSAKQFGISIRLVQNPSFGRPGPLRPAADEIQAMDVSPKILAWTRALLIKDEYRPILATVRVLERYCLVGIYCSA
jgi:hypothetical protein